MGVRLGATFAVALFGWGCAATVQVDASTRAELNESADGKEATGAQKTSDGAAASSGVAPSAVDVAAAKERGCLRGMVLSGDGCCWPEQRWSAAQNKCSGVPTCPPGFVRGGFECAAKDDEEARLALSCSKAVVDDTLASNDTASEHQSACYQFPSLLPDAMATLQRRCDKGSPSSCAMLGAAQMHVKTVAVSIELLSPVCKSRGATCHGHEQRVQQMPFGTGAASQPAAEEAFRRACEGDHVGSCMELALLVDKTALFAEACAKGHPSACAEAFYRSTVGSRVVDPKLNQVALQVLGKRCDEGGALACNNLGFIVERLEGHGPAAAAKHYANACNRGGALGCANLVFLAENHGNLRKKFDFGSVASLEQSCVDAPDNKEVCHARGLSLRRGYGVKQSFSKGTKLLRGLCRGGYRLAC